MSAPQAQEASILHQVSNDFVRVLIPRVSSSILIAANRLCFSPDHPIWSPACESKIIHHILMGSRGQSRMIYVEDKVIGLRAGVWHGGQAPKCAKKEHVYACGSERKTQCCKDTLFCRRVPPEWPGSGNIEIDKEMTILPFRPSLLLVELTSWSYDEEQQC